DTNQAKPRRKHAKYLDTRSGRIRLAAIADNSAASIQAFVKANVKAGATLLTDGHASYLALSGYRHDPRVVGKMAGHVALPWIHRVFALMKRWGLGTYLKRMIERLASAREWVDAGQGFEAKESEVRAGGLEPPAARDRAQATPEGRRGASLAGRPTAVPSGSSERSRKICCGPALRNDRGTPSGV